MGPVQDNVYAGNPNAYINHLHDAGYLDKYDVGTRREIEASIGRYSDGPPPSYYRTASQYTAPPARPAPAQPTAPIVPLSSFFDRYGKLVWPGGSPDYGDLAVKRTAANLACLAVLNDYNLRGLAQIGTVTEARAKLIEYGRPALQYITANSTPRVADTFHLFLLSLYESLAQAATIPKTPSPSPAESDPRPRPRARSGRGPPATAALIGASRRDAGRPSLDRPAAAGNTSVDKADNPTGCVTRPAHFVIVASRLAPLRSS